MEAAPTAHVGEWKVLVMAVKVERKEWAPKVLLGCLWRIFWAMVCLVEWMEVKLEWV